MGNGLSAVCVVLFMLLMSEGSTNQVHRDFRKPLIVMSPKNLLRHKDCKSDLTEFDEMHQTSFKRLLQDQNHLCDLEKGVTRLLLCSGKVIHVNYDS